MSSTTNNNDASPDEALHDRERLCAEGKCPNCGTQLYHFKKPKWYSLKKKKSPIKKEPLNVNGKVIRGECLQCYSQHQEQNNDSPNSDNNDGAEIQYAEVLTVESQQQQEEQEPPVRSNENTRGEGSGDGAAIVSSEETDEEIAIASGHPDDTSSVADGDELEAEQEETADEDSSRSGHLVDMEQQASEPASTNDREQIAMEKKSKTTSDNSTQNVEKEQQLETDTANDEKEADKQPTTDENDASLKDLSIQDHDQDEIAEGTLQAKTTVPSEAHATADDEEDTISSKEASLTHGQGTPTGSAVEQQHEVSDSNKDNSIHTNDSSDNEESQPLPPPCSSPSVSTLGATAQQQVVDDKNPNWTPALPTIAAIPIGAQTLQTDASNTTYKGPFNSFGKRHGEGELRWSNGDHYVGQFWCGVREGHGILYFANGSEYVGSWENNKMNGQGTQRFPNGDVYTGHYVDGKRSGQGRCYFANGDLYKGSWYNDHRNGHGLYFYNHGQCYDGMFRNDLRHGMGKYQLGNGKMDVYRYENDERVGEGVRWSANRKKAWRLVNGKVKGRISLQKAQDITRRIQESS